MGNAVNIAETVSTRPDESAKAGEMLDASSVRAIRPGLGLAPKFIDMVMGKVVKRDVKRGTPVSWDLLF